eukprot:3940508-Rhodomonas_salina.6
MSAQRRIHERSPTPPLFVPRNHIEGPFSGSKAQPRSVPESAEVGIAYGAPAVRGGARSTRLVASRYSPGSTVQQLSTGQYLGGA